MFQFGTLFSYKFIFATELLVSMVMFTWTLPLRKKPWLRIPLALGAYYLAVLLIPIGDYSYNLYYVSFLFLFIFAVSLPLLFLVFDTPFNSILFCATGAYTTQHFAYECFNFFQNTFYLHEQNGIFGYGKGEQESSFFNPIVLTLYFIVYIDIYFLSYVAFAGKIKRNEELRLKRMSVLFILIIFLAIDIIFNACLTFYSYTNYDRTYMMFEESYNMICCLVILVVQFTMVRERHLETQVEFYSNLLEQEKRQYEQNKVNIERLNIKAHDLKHQIIALGQKESISSEELEDISEAVSLYDKSYQTENEALNIVLMEKENVCRKYEIQMSVIADGNCLSFLKENDLYALFGNALDNAIEASMNLPKEKRFISLVTGSKNSFVSISLQNFIDHQVEMKDGRPVTSKTDKENHGFGIRSMEIIVAKYHGDISFQTKNGIFLLKILLPIPQI